MGVEAELAALKAKLAEMDAAITSRDARIAELEALVEQLREKLGRNSTNSHLPPSSDPPESQSAQAERRKRKKGQRKRRGQPGHKGSHRELLAVEQVDQIENLFPDRCDNCWESLSPVVDPSAKRYQFTELRPLIPHTTEYRRHRVACAHCGHRTWAAYDRR